MLLIKKNFNLNINIKTLILFYLIIKIIRDIRSGLNKKNQAYYNNIININFN